MVKSVESYQDFINRVYNTPMQIQYPKTKTITFQITEDCNFNCTYCYQTNKSNVYMEWETAKVMVDLLLSGDRGFKEYLGTENVIAVCLEFIGGEPFLAVDLMDQILNYFYDRAIELHHPWAKNFMISICSNGSLYFEPQVQQFLERWKSRLSFSITLDGNKRLHDSCRLDKAGNPTYAIAVAAVKDWMSRGYYMGSKLTFVKENLQFLAEAITNLLDLGYTTVLGNCAYEPDWDVKDARVFYSQLEELANILLDRGGPEKIYCSLFEENFFKPLPEDFVINWCGGTGEMLAVDPNGDLYPCIRYMGSSLGKEQKPLRIGSVTEGIGKAAECADCIRYLQKVDRKTQSEDECISCPIAAGCSWCSAYNYQTTGDVNKRVTKLCVMHQARALANYYYWNQWYQATGQNKRKMLYMPDDWSLQIVSEDKLQQLKALV